jgi:hypothetical protein
MNCQRSGGVPSHDFTRPPEHLSVARATKGRYFEDHRYRRHRTRRIEGRDQIEGVVEVAGPEQFRLDELVGRYLSAHDDPRSVVADPRARYYGAELGERTLVPDDASLGEIGIDDWLSQSVSTTA